MRVGTFLRTWHPGGGVTRHTLELIERIDDVEWICFGHRFEADVPNPVEIRGVPGPRAVQDVVNLVRSPRLVRRLKTDHDLDLFHAQDVNLMGHDLVTVHSCFPAYARAELSRLYTLVHPMYHKNLISQKLVLERSEGPIVSVSHALRDDLLEFYDLDPDRVEVIHNGVDLDRFHPDRDGEAVRDRHGLDGDVILFVGHEHERKGFDEILQAMTRLEEVSLMAVGGGDHAPWKRRARQLGVADRVTWAGFVPDEELPDHYAAADVFVFPTRYESFGLVVLEAMACGVPVVAGDLPPIREFVEDGRDGRLVRPRDPEEVAEAVEEVLDRAEAMGRRARESSTRFGWDRAAEETRRLYGRIVDGD